MNDISSIVSALLSMNQAQAQDRISADMIKMDAEAEAAMADMLIENARQIAALTHAAAGGRIDTFV